MVTRTSMPGLDDPLGVGRGDVEDGADEGEADGRCLRFEPVHRHHRRAADQGGYGDADAADVEERARGPHRLVRLEADEIGL